MYAFFLPGTQLILSKHFGVGCQRNVGHRKTQGWGCKMSQELKEESGWRKWGQRETALGYRGRNFEHEFSNRKKRKSKTQESRGFQSVVRKEYLECLLVASLRMEHAPLFSAVPSLTFHHSCLRVTCLKSPSKEVAEGRLCAQASVIPRSVPL